MYRYSRVLPRAQKLFSAKMAVKNALPTLNYNLFSNQLEPSDKITLFTSNIFPPLATLWYHFVQKYLGDKVEMFIFDCSGKLDPHDFPNVRMQKYVNAMHPTKIDAFLKKSTANRDIIWICDDDLFPISNNSIDILKQEFSKQKTVMVSFRPRTWWHFDIDGKEIEPCGSYCTAINRDTFVNKEHLSARTADNNPHPSKLGKKNMRYDTLDKANEDLIMRGYKCTVVEEKERDECICGFDGTSGGALLLDYFKSPKSVIKHLNKPPDEKWKGTVLHGTLKSLLQISAVQNMYTELMGRPYPLLAMPHRSELDAIRERVEPFIPFETAFNSIDLAEKKLMEKL